MKIEMDDNAKEVCGWIVIGVFVSAALFVTGHMFLAETRERHAAALRQTEAYLKAGMQQKQMPTAMGTTTIWVKAEEKK